MTGSTRCTAPPNDPPQIDAERILLLLGAGASVSSPANRPTFAQLAQGLLVAAGLSSDDTPSLKAPEVLFYELGRNHISPEPAIVRCVDGGRPNDVHQVAAAVLRAGGVVWTTNYDTLVEQAYGLEEAMGLRVSHGERPDPKRHRLCKPHGTVPEGPLVFDSRQVVRPLDPAWADLLRFHAQDRLVVVVGYAGADVDLFGPLRDALQSGSLGFEWFIHQPTPSPDTEAPADWVGWRFGIETRPPSRDAASEFVDWAGSMDPRLMIADIDAPRVDDIADATGPNLAPTVEEIASYFDDVHDDRFARACLRVMLGARKGTLRLQLADAVLRPRAVPPRTRAKKLVSTLATRRLFGVDRTLWYLARHLPRALISDYVFVRTSNWAERAGRYEEVREMYERRPAPSGDAEGGVDRLLNLASVERYLGHLDDAVDHAAEALARAVDDNGTSIDRVARAAFESATCRRWLGDWDGAEEVLRASLAGIGSPRWTGWIQFDRGLLAMHRGRPERAVAHLEQAARIFDDDGHLRGATFARLAEITAKRALMAARSAPPTPDTIASLQTQLALLRRHIRPRDRASRDGFELERAELFRLAHRRGEAAAGYALLQASPYPVSRCLGHLGAAALAADDDERDRHLERARREASFARCAYLLGRARAPGIASTPTISPRARPAALAGSSEAVDSPILFA